MKDHKHEWETIKDDGKEVEEKCKTCGLWIVHQRK